MKDNTTQQFPKKSLLRNAYDDYYIYLSAIVLELEHKIKNILELSSIPILKSRVKTFQSYYKKLLRLNSSENLNQRLPNISDLIGIRIICPFLEDIQLVEAQISTHYKVLEVERKGANRAFSEFGYESTHILIEIPSDVKKNKILPPNLICEIQARTILQDAWAEVEHELVYKAEFSPFDLPLKRKLASMNASLSLADIIFQEIRDYQKKLNKELDCRRMLFYDKADSVLHDLSLNEFNSVGHDDIVPLPPVSPYVQGTIDDLLLEAIHAQNTRQFEKAISIYTQIIDSNSSISDVVLSVILNHRGMTYFAHNQFDQALQDFQLSASLNKKNQRSWYYLGIVNSVLGNESVAVENFSSSLELNPFQPHAYFRCALSLYHLGDYASALANLSKAVDLGLENEDTEKFHVVLLEKLDIK